MGKTLKRLKPLVSIKRINSASEELCTLNPELFSDHKVLLECAWEWVHEMSYIYKKGKTQSKSISTPEADDTPKQSKISSDACLRRIGELQERLGNIHDWIGFKEKHWERAQATRDYKECDCLTTNVSIENWKETASAWTLQSAEATQVPVVLCIGKKASGTTVSSDNLLSKKGQKGTSRHSPVYLFTPPFQVIVHHLSLSLLR